MQTIGVSCAAIAAVSLRLTVWSVSPNNRRRSECPMITYSAPASLIIGALTSPVNAPSRSQYTFCAATPMFDACAASTTGRTAVNGGAMTISTSCTSFSIGRISFTNATASCTVLYIFQFAAMNGVRMGILDPKPASAVSDEPSSVRERRHARQFPAAQKFERRAAAGRDVRDPVAHARLRDRRDRIAAADHRCAVDRRNRLRNVHRALRELIDLEHTHRPVPEGHNGRCEGGCVGQR